MAGIHLKGTAQLAGEQPGMLSYIQNKIQQSLGKSLLGQLLSAVFGKNPSAGGKYSEVKKDAWTGLLFSWYNLIDKVKYILFVLTLSTKLNLYNILVFTKTVQLHSTVAVLQYNSNSSNLSELIFKYSQLVRTKGKQKKAEFIFLFIYFYTFVSTQLN